MIKLKAEEYIADVMADGCLSLPEKIAKQLKLNHYSRVRVIIQEAEERTLSEEAKQKALAIKKFVSDINGSVIFSVRHVIIQ
jgi:hypothetical protein